MTKGSKTSKYGTKSRISHDASDYYNSKLYTKMPDENTTPPDPDQPYPEELMNKILIGNAENMQDIPDNSVHLMVTSPPYNVNKIYDQDLSIEEYMHMLSNVFKETFRVLVYGGRACVNIANLGRKPYIPLSDYITLLMSEIGFLMRGEIIWEKGAGAGVSMAWGSWMSASNPVLRDTHEYILVFSKGSFSRNRRKDQVNTIKRDDFMQWTKSVWTMSPESAKRLGHPAPFPVELPFRLIQLYTFLGDIVLDPFMGSGSTAIAAIKSERSFIGYEIDEEYVKLANRRMSEFNERSKYNG